MFMRVSSTLRLVMATGLSATLFLSPAPANESVDPNTTGAISANATTSSPAGTAAFQGALQMLDAGDYAGAYEVARGFSDPVERRTIQWTAIYFGDGDVDHASVSRFAADAPEFSTASLYRTRLEQALMDANPGPSEIISYLGGAMPQTIDAQIALAEAYVADGQAERAQRIAREIWINNFLDNEQEARVMQTLGRLLTPADHWARGVHLMMHDRITGTERLSSFYSSAQMSLVRARAAVARSEGNAQSLLDQVDPQYRDHPLFHFSRGQLARKSGNLSAAVDLFNQATGDLPDAAEWWYERRLLARQLLAAGNPRNAYRAVAPYQTGPEGRVVDANFHAGWIALEFLGDANAAAQHFENMRALSTLGSTVTKSNYWLGRALSARGDEAGATAAFRRAAIHHTQYYGLLSRYRLGIRDVDIRPLPSADASIPQFEALPLVRAVRLLEANGHDRYAEPLVSRLIYSVDTAGEMLLTARLAQDVNAHQLAILMADVANDKGVALDLFGYPRDGIPDNVRLAEVDRAAIYAVARQESHFDVDAISHAGARGIMQLMPATAEETAQRLGISYSPSRLTSDPGYNALLGSTYLGAQLNRYDGSLILAAAAYNAGAGNVNKWIEAYGNPMNGSIDPVVWIEQIPFTETRNYVKRVVANYMFYRARLNSEQPTIAEVLRRIKHG